MLWLAGSAVFSIYTANFAQYNETYGSLGAVVVVMLWLFLTGFVVIFGAELNAEVERQTHKDSTVGRPSRSAAERAYAADTVGETAEDYGRAKRPPGATKCGERRARAPTHSPFRPQITVLDIGAQPRSTRQRLWALRDSNPDPLLVRHRRMSAVLGLRSGSQEANGIVRD